MFLTTNLSNPSWQTFSLQDQEEKKDFLKKLSYATYISRQKDTLLYHQDSIPFYEGSRESSQEDLCM